MTLYIPPYKFQWFAISFSQFKWTFLAVSFFCFGVYGLMAYAAISSNSMPHFWWSNVSMLTGMQVLLVSGVIFFFECLPSSETNDKFWLTLYKRIENIEAFIFSFMLPMPVLMFLFILISTR